MQRDWITSAFPKASFRKCSQVKRKCPLSQHPERPALTNKFGPFDGGLRRSSGRCHFTPVGRSLSKAPLGKQKTGHHPEDPLFGSALPPDIPRVLGELEIAPIKTEPITSLSLSPDAWATTGHQDVTRPVAGCFPKGSGFYRVLIRPMRPWTIQSPSSLRYRSSPVKRVFGGNQIYEISPLSTRRHLRHNPT